MITDAPSWTAFVKAATGISGPPRPSLAWANARRANMLVYADRVEIGNWVLRHDEVTHATLYETQRGIKNRVLEIATPARVVQINFNPGISPEGHLPYDIAKVEFPKGLAKFRVVFWVFVVVLFAMAAFG